MRFFVSPSRTTRTSPNWCRRWIWLRWGTASPWHTPVSIAPAEADRTCRHPPPSVCSALTSPDPLRAFINFVESDIGRRARTGSGVSAYVNCCVGTREGLLFLRCAAGFFALNLCSGNKNPSIIAQQLWTDLYIFKRLSPTPCAPFAPGWGGETKRQSAKIWTLVRWEQRGWGGKKTPRCIYVSKLQWWFIYLFIYFRRKTKYLLPWNLQTDMLRFIHAHSIPIPTFKSAELPSTSHPHSSPLWTYELIIDRWDIIFNHLI